VTVLAALLLSACGGGGGNSDAVLTEAAQIAFTALTQTAAVVTPTSTASPVPPTATPTVAPPTLTPTPEGTLPTATQQPAQQQPQNGNVPCLRANLETETIPDGTKYMVGTNFTKTWRIKNIGSCTWTAAFNAVWIQGDLMDADSAVPFTEKDIPPGGYAEIEINMRAPNPAGPHKGYWMLRSADGITFGLGTNGKEWFWVQIESLPDQDE
jgi:hypothetical protein